jgi:hypothetical protein
MFVKNYRAHVQFLSVVRLPSPRDDTAKSSR